MTAEQKRQEARTRAMVTAKAVADSAGTLLAGFAAMEQHSVEHHQAVAAMLRAESEAFEAVVAQRDAALRRARAAEGHLPPHTGRAHRLEFAGDHAEDCDAVAFDLDRCTCGRGLPWSAPEGATP